MKVSGWLFDSYSLGDRMVFWLVTADGRAVRLEDRWIPAFYVAAQDKSDLTSLTKDVSLMQHIQDFEFVPKYERLSDSDAREVLKLIPKDARRARSLAKRIWMSGHFGRYRLYNVDLLPAQSYFYEHDLFATAHCDVYPSAGALTWTLNDSVWETDYRLPPFKTVHLEIKPRKEGKVAKITDRIDSITLKTEAETIEIKQQSETEAEAEAIKQLVSEVARIDPDFIFTVDGDLFSLPYLISRASQNHVDLYLNREPVKLTSTGRDGNSFFRYGKIYFKPAAIDLMGRIHLDSRNSFVWSESGMHGYFEVARICRMPLHSAFRASIGTCLSSLQFYHATKKDILIPWKPTEAEHFKSLEELLVADRGGLILVPKVGVHEKVAEFDFVSLFPSIMRKKNVSGETVRCDCCPDSDKRVPELDCNICNKREGIVPISLDIVLKKRAKYKMLKKSTKNPVLREIYADRQDALKWINVTSFGYLGFNKSRFGKIDSHQAVCAFDREIMLKTMRTAESLKFKIIHGIVDSLWVTRPGSSEADYTNLKQAIEEATGFEISFEGEYNWIVFLPSKSNDWLPVPNRYFGLFKDGTLKVRGLEARRHDTPPFFAKVQGEILKIMAKGENIDKVKALMPEVTSFFEKCVGMLKRHEVPISELVFTKQLSKGSGECLGKNTVEFSAIQQLAEHGLELRAGQIIQFVITDNYRNNTRKRSVPVELIDGKTTYDAKRYIELLARVCNSVTEPFGNSFSSLAL